MPEHVETTEPTFAPAPAAAPVAAPGPGAGAAGPGLVTHLARSPVEERAAAIDQLQGTIGNRRVTRMLAASGVLQREPQPHPGELITERVDAPNGRQFRISEYGTDPNERLKPGQKATQQELYWVDFEVDAKGTMKASARTQSADGKFKSPTLRLGEQFGKAREFFAGKGTEVSRFAADWSYMSPIEMSVNLREYQKALDKGMKPNEAAFETPSGKVAKGAGFTKAELVSDKVEKSQDFDSDKPVRRVRMDFSRPTGGGTGTGGGPKVPPVKPPPTNTTTGTRVKAAAGLAIMGASIVLNRIIESGNEDRIRAALKAREADMTKLLQAEPTLGFLLVFRFEGASKGLEGSHASGRFTRFSFRRGYTESEARAAWNAEPRHMERGVEHEFGWVAPAEAPDPMALATPFVKVGLARWANPRRMVFVRASFAEWGGFGEKGTDGPHEPSKYFQVYEKHRFVVLRMPPKLGFMGAGRRNRTADVTTTEVAVGGGKAPAVMLDSTAAVTVWPADESTEAFFRKFSRQVSYKEGTLAGIPNIDIVRWLPPDQVQLVGGSDAP